MNRLAYTRAAQQDLLEYFEQRYDQLGHAPAMSAVETMVERCEDLARFPEMGRRRADLDALGLHTRAIRQDGRLIVYIKRSGTVHVVRIIPDRG